MSHRPYPCAARARAQIIRHDLPGYTRYRAELHHTHYKPRAVLGISTTTAQVDETHVHMVGAFQRTFLDGARHADWVAKLCDEQLGKRDPVPNCAECPFGATLGPCSPSCTTPSSYRCACGQEWPNSSLDVGHTYVQCEPYGR